MKANNATRPIEAALADLIEEFRARPTIRAGSLITTVFGDSIAPRGGSVWLGSLIALLEELGVSERLVRTSVFRLAKDGWLESRQVGRRSYYSLTADGRERFRTATLRIYGEPRPSWDGEWRLLLLPGLDAATRDAVRRECGWLGFGALTSNVLAHPSADDDELDNTLERLGVRDDVVVMRGHGLGEQGGLHKLVAGAWDLGELDSGYRVFVDRFDAARSALIAERDVKPASAFLLRTLLLQEYRRLLLRDPQLPAELLPRDWHGVKAYALCRELYRGLYRACDAYLGDTVETADGPLPAPDADYYQRFGGLRTRK
ncbi:MAG: phenylacetic acid degradation operon negative regulatory protein PaaX [Pseudomonadota bacterium]